MEIIVIIAESTTGNTPCNSTQSRDKADHGDGFQTPTQRHHGRRKSQPPKGKRCSVFFFFK